MLILFTSWMIIPGLAEDTDELAVEVEEEVNGTQSYLCGQNLAVEAEALIFQYSNFLELQTSDASDNSDRLEDIMSYYRYVVDTLDTRLMELSDLDRDNENFEASTQEYLHCEGIRDQYYLMAESMLRTYFTSSTGSKTTFKVVDGLKAMNESLQGMSQSYHATFPGMYNKFSNAFPCYVNSCVGK